MASLIAQLVKNPPAMQETWVWSLGGEDPLGEGTPVFWPGEFHGLYSPWGSKESDMTEQLSLSLSIHLLGFPGGSVGKNLLPMQEIGDSDSIPGSGRSLGEGNGDPLQHSCLENSMDRGDWRITDHGVPKSGTQLSTLTHMCVCVCVYFFSFWYSFPL